MNEDKDEEINPWASDIVEIKKEDFAGKKLLVATSAFTCIFPKYREQYIKECWDLVVKQLEDYVSFRIRSSFCNAFNLTFVLCTNRKSKEN